MLTAFAVCLVGCMKWGEIDSDLNGINGIYAAAHFTCVQTNASGKIINEERYLNNPGWPGSYRVYYDFSSDGKIRGYYCYSYWTKDGDLYWSLRQTDEQCSGNYFISNGHKRIVETNLWNSEYKRMTVYCSDDEEIQLWLENPSLGKRWYDVYKLSRLTNLDVLRSLREAKEDNQENRGAIDDEINRLMRENQ